MQRARHNRAVLAYASALAEDPINVAATIGRAGALISLDDLAKADQVLSGIREVLSLVQSRLADTRSGRPIQPRREATSIAPSN